tara:strand:+ start:2053 stop:2289 length:237 start_codon:yes stop_codon:yes gene_type:complete
MDKSKVTFMIHRVHDGPREDKTGTWWLNCLVQDTDNNELFDEEVPFISFDSAYEFKKHFTTSIEPIKLEFDTDRKYDA